MSPIMGERSGWYRLKDSRLVGPEVAYPLLMALMLFATVHLLLGRGMTARAQPQIDCSDPRRVSSDIARFSAFAHLAADRYGRLHLIWSSGVEADRNEEQIESDTIFYTMWDGSGWQQPIDIMSDANYATADSIVITQDDRVIITWRNHSTLFVSQVQLPDAGSAANWRTRSMGLGPLADSALVVDANNRLHLAYAAYDPAAGTGGMGYTWSDDGLTWSEPTTVSVIDAADAIETEVRMLVTDLGQVHVVWQRNTRAAQWLPTAVLYAVSNDGGSTWQGPTRVFVGERAGMPNLAKGFKPGRFYMNWLRGVGADDSKYLKWSNDGGRIWTGADLVFKNLPGLNGAMPIVVDTAGTEYWIMSGDTNAGTQILYTMRSEDDPWPSPTAVSGELKDSEFADAVVVRGNQLHIVWNDFVEDDVYHAICVLDAPALTAEPVPTAQPTTAPPTSTPPATLTPSLQPTAVQTVVPIDESPQPASSALQPIGLAVILVVVLIGGVLIWRGLRRR